MDFDLSSGTHSPVVAGYDFTGQAFEDESVQPMDIGARTAVLLLPGGQSTTSAPPPSRAPIVDLSSASRQTDIARANVRRTDGVDDVSPNVVALYQLYNALSGRVFKKNHMFFVQVGRQQAPVLRNDSILDDAQALGSLEDRTAAFAARLALQAQASQPTMVSSLESMSAEEVLQGLQDGSITFNAGAEQAFNDAATGTMSQFMKNFPDAMDYPFAIEAWILAAARTPGTRTLFAELAQAYMNETDMGDPSYSNNQATLQANASLAIKPSRLIITDPYKTQMLENLSAVTGIPVRTRRIQPLDYLILPNM
jgi:hypothetical protein